MSDTAMIEIIVNGEEYSLPKGTSVTELIKSLDLHAQRLAIELNLKILARDEWDQTILYDGDKLEIVHFVGGG